MHCLATKAGAVGRESRSGHKQENRSVMTGFLFGYVLAASPVLHDRRYIQMPEIRVLYVIFTYKTPESSFCM